MTDTESHNAARIVSMVLAAVAAAGCYLYLVPSGCSDIGGVPSWERCVSVMGTPAFSVEDFGWAATLNVLPPLIIGVAVGLVSWWAIRKT